MPDTATNSLLFGIPSLDGLFASGAGGIQLKGAENHSIAISGPPGSGKSLLGLHLGASFLASGKDRKILYASTDYTLDQAANQIGDFGLNNENREADPIYRSKALKSGSSAMAPEPLKDKLLPFGVLKDAHRSPDIWLELARIVSVYAEETKGSPPNLLVIIDGLEGFSSKETMDEFGMHALQRDRMTELLNVCERRAHCLFILESHQTTRYMPEEYLVGTAIRLSVEYQQEYARRYIEILKCRSQIHSRGKHTMIIRRKNPKTDGKTEDPSYPFCDHSYISVIPSIDTLDTWVRNGGQP